MGSILPWAARLAGGSSGVTIMPLVAGGSSEVATLPPALATL